MICLVYVSIAVGKPDQEALVELLRQSRRNNARDRITGILLYKNGEYMQILEGNEQLVLDLFGRIQVDRRNTNVTELIRFNISRRAFPNWTMGFRNLDEIPAEDRETFSPFLELPLTAKDFAASPHQAVRLLLRFKDLVDPWFVEEAPPAFHERRIKRT